MAANRKSAPVASKSKLPPTDPVKAQMDATNRHAAKVPFNKTKAQEFGSKNANSPPAGATIGISDPTVTGSTLSEPNASAKTGEGALPGACPVTQSLDRVRTDAAAQVMTTNQGVAIGDNQSSLKAGLRGPTLLEDFILREKITHFDHERIPERIVHARGSAAHGFFEAYDNMKSVTRAAPFQAKGKVTPVFVRFSTVAGERGSKDTARDVRGFAIKFYTDEGNWDLVGNNMPVFFIQDAMKFPDLVHAVKPEPHNGMPQAASAHDTFWDFVSLMPESTHMLMWVMSDRALPRSLRMMQGFGVHTFRLVNEAGESVFCKFHFKPKLGVHSLAWDEAVKISGADPDYHRRDLWDAIESGNYPEWEMGFQIFNEADAEKYSFDVLDATKLIPEELVPVTPVGRLVLNRNPDNFFAETEQVAFCTAHIIPGIDFSHDPLLAGRIHSYVDTQITRLGGPNFHEIPINSPLAPTHNNQRDGMHRHAISRGRVSYEPNSLGGGCPFQAGAKGFVSFPVPIADDKVRGKPEKFAEHYNQAALFYESQTPVEQAHIAAAFRFELSKVGVPAIRERMLASLRNASPSLAKKVADGLGIALPAAIPRALDKVPKAEIATSARLSQAAFPGEEGARTRAVGFLVADGIALDSLEPIMRAAQVAGCFIKVIGPRVGDFTSREGRKITADASLENSPSVLFDAWVLPDGEDGVMTLARDPHTGEGLRDAWRHCKTILAIGASQKLLDVSGIASIAPKNAAELGLNIFSGNQASIATSWFIDAVAKHRHPDRDRDPPAI